MLHELLLSLSGHPSPLLDKTSGLSESLQSIASPAELTLLGSLADDLGKKHLTIRNISSTISSSHPSPACRAVASAIISIHLAAFQQRILEVEKDILKRDASLVGGYNVVPLSAVVGAFEGWGRRLEWLRDLVQFVQSAAPRGVQDRPQACTASLLIERLRDSMHTGYPDIEEMALSLVKVAETAWLKQLSAWALYGRHPGEDDFFVTIRDTIGDDSSLSMAFQVKESLLPPFVTSNTANSVFFIGKSLNHIRERQRPGTKSTSSTSTPELALLPAHLAHLSALQSPISSAGFSATVNAIRLSLSQNALQKLLPISKVMDILYILKDFFLLERGEFAVALITSADDRLKGRSRHGALSSKNTPTLEESLASMTIKEGEVNTVLARTWTALASLQSDQNDEDIDEELDQARDLLHLSIKSTDPSRVEHRDHSREKAPLFDDLLLPSSTTLSIKVSSPLDLFLTADDTEAYSRIHAYLIAIRRAHLRLSKLFLLSKLRRDHPCPKVPIHLVQKEKMSILKRKRQLSNNRTKVLRPAWATIGSATFFFAELSEYFQGEVIQRSWTAFHSWLIPEITDHPKSSSSSKINFGSTSHRPGSSKSSRSSHLGSSRPTSSRAANNNNNNNNTKTACPTPHDPETLTQAHQRYLNHLTHSLLLANPTFARPLRRLMTSVDHIIALLHRLSALQTNLDNLSADGPPAEGEEEEESTLLSDLRASLPPISKGMHDLVEILRGIDETRHLSGPSTPSGANGEAGRGEIATSRDLTWQGGGTQAFEPWSSRSLDRLLLKFDFGTVDDFLNGGVEGVVKSSV